MPELVNYMAKPRVIVVSNRLPVNITEEAGELVLKRSVGGLATALGSVMNSHSMLWIGWPGTWQRLTKKQLLGLNFPDLLVPVLISKRLLTRYYNRVSSGVLWPILHGIKPAKLDQEADWKATGEVMNLFAEAVEANLRPDDVIWIHDYHLPLLPQVLRKRGINNRMGFFLHTPFPRPAVFMNWRHHRPILESLSQVDVLGFQTERDVRNFKASLKAAGVALKEGSVVQAFPIGVDYKTYRAADRMREVADYLNRLRIFKSPGKKLILSVSRLDYTKGIVQQLQAVELALQQYEPGTLEYRLVVAPSREALQEYQTLKDEVEATVKRINARWKDRHGIEPITYEYRSHGFEELSAWYRMADVLLVTPIIDGMNLVVKEYIAARGAKLGAVVLSRTIGAAWQLNDAVLVNPASLPDISRGLMHALDMPLVEQGRRWNALLKNVRQEDVFWWTNSFLDALYAQELASTQA
jgi:trehalose 6-phosphate synthase/phosphatase